MKSESKGKSRRKKRRINWDKYTDFRSRHSTDDLAKLCVGFQRKELEYILNIPDETGLCPIHWASIHNRSDLIEFLIDHGANMRLRCRNKLFADGSTLHLAAINGCVEAAGMLLRKYERLQQETKPKTLEMSTPPPEEDHKIKSSTSIADWLSERDADGQTPLMRSAAPRSKRLDIVRDLLRKNLWSLSARPAEMALFLISKGANWRETESKFSMNLMHLAIMNNYDDIVNMLIVTDNQLLEIPARIQTDNMRVTRQVLPKVKSPQSKSPNEFVTVKLEPSSPSSASSSNTEQQQQQTKPLIDRQEVASNLLSSGLSPLQLAIVYGRLNIISLIWNASKQPPNKDISISKGENKSSATTSAPTNNSELRATLLRVVWSNKDELFNLIRGSLLKILLAVDLALLTLVWMPVYLTGKTTGETLNLKGGIFLASYCVSLALASRVIAKNPGYLSKGTEEYLQELDKLVRVDKEAKRLKENFTKTNDKLEQRDSLPVQNQGSRNEFDAAKNNQLPSRIADKEGPLQSSRPVKLPDLEERVRLLCHRCRTIRKPRSRHCNYCNRCVKDFDHHCMYLGCCIGRFNRLDFLIMMVAVSLTAIYGTIIQANWMDKEHWKHFWHFVGLIWIGKYALIGTMNVFFILRRASLGVTMYEEIRSNRIRRIFGPNGAPLNIMKSHKMYSTLKGSFWRYAPDRFLTGDLPSKRIIKNMKEFTNLNSISDYFIITLCADSSLARSMESSIGGSKVTMYKNL